MRQVFEICLAIWWHRDHRIWFVASACINYLVYSIKTVNYKYNLCNVADLNCDSISHAGKGFNSVIYSLWPLPPLVTTLWWRISVYIYAFVTLVSYLFHLFIFSPNSVQSENVFCHICPTLYLCQWSSCVIYVNVIKSLVLLFCCSMPFFETSAATGQNVDKAVEALLNKVMVRIESIVDKSMFHGKRQVNENDNSNSSCSC